MAAFPKYTYKNVTTGGPVIKTGTGTLYAIVINKALAGTVTITDGATKIGILTNGTTAPLGSVIYNVQFGTNLQVVLSTTEDITVCYE